MTTRTRYVRTVDDRVMYVARNIVKGKRSAKVHALSSMALTDFCGNGWCVKERDWIGEVCAITDFIRNNVRYTLDTHGIDTYRSPDKTLELAMGDCDDMTALAGAALQAVGYPVWIKVIQMGGQDQFHHIYVMAGIPPENPQKVIAVDASQPFPCGWEPHGIKRAKLYRIS